MKIIKLHFTLNKQLPGELKLILVRRSEYVCATPMTLNMCLWQILIRESKDSNLHLVNDYLTNATMRYLGFIRAFD